VPSTIFTSPPEFALACAVLIMAQIVYVVFGFGSGLIAVGGLTLLFPEVKDVVVLLLLVNLPAEIIVVKKSWRQIHWRPISALSIGIAIGIPLGAYMLRETNPQLILNILGYFLVTVGLLFLRLPDGGRIHPPTWAAPPVGLLSGWLTGLLGTGGPPLIIWYHLSAGNKAIFRANLMTIFLLMTFLRVPSYAFGGLIKTKHLWSTFAVLPAVFFGVWLGNRLHLKISEIWFRRLVSGLLIVLGLMQLW